MKIRSKKELMYDAYTQESAILESAVTSYEVFSGQIVIEDAYIDENGVPQVFKIRKAIIEPDEVNTLFSDIGQDIMSTDVFTDEVLQLVATAQLHDVEGHPIYGSEPGDFELV